MKITQKLNIICAYLQHSPHHIDNMVSKLIQPYRSRIQIYIHYNTRPATKDIVTLLFLTPTKSSVRHILVTSQNQNQLMNNNIKNLKLHIYNKKN